MLDRIAKKRREEGEKNGRPVNIFGPNELKTFSERFSVREILITWIRPFRMFLTEPIVLTLSMLSGFSDAIIFMFLQSYGLVFRQWNYQSYQIGLTFVAIGLGYLIAWLSFFPAIKRNIRERTSKPHDEHAQYEARLWWLLYTAPALPVGLIIFAWTSTGPPIHWMGPLIGSAIIGIANYAIYMATIDYMICAYGPYSASATGGNGWARDFLAGVLTLPATPFFSNIGGKYHLAYASTILFAISLLLVLSVFVIYWKGPELRKRSPFAQQLNAAREEAGGRRVSNVPGLYGASRANSYVGHQGGSVPGSRRGSIKRGAPA